MWAQLVCSRFARHWQTFLHRQSNRSLRRLVKIQEMAYVWSEKTPKTYTCRRQEIAAQKGFKRVLLSQHFEIPLKFPLFGNQHFAEKWLVDKRGNKLPHSS
jgi:hypothetical protein